MCCTDIDTHVFELLPIALFFAAALLYTSVGHGGASGYLAMMSLMGFAPALMRSTSLSLNIAAASVAFGIFAFNNVRDRSLNVAMSLKLLAPFLIASMPMAYIGGLLNLQTQAHKVVVGAVLLWAAWQLFSFKKQTISQLTSLQMSRAVPWWSWPAGALMGLVSGLTGVGGGIFLSPLLVLTGLCTVRQSAPLSAAFIVLNSITGLLGVLHGGKALAPHLAYWIACVILAAILGASWGSRTLHTVLLRRVLAAVLVLAGVKLIVAML
jgi:uncharacterized protein